MRPERLYEAPRNAFVAHFIGENNRLSGRVTAIEEARCTVELDNGGTIGALAINVAGTGALTTVSLRPERVRVGGDAEACPNRFDAEVRELIYLGDHTRMRLCVCGEDDFIVKIAHTRGPPDLRPGDRVPVGFTVDDCRALDRW